MIRIKLTYDNQTGRSIFCTATIGARLPSCSTRMRRDGSRSTSPSFQTCYAKLAMKRISAMRKRWTRIVPLAGALALMTAYALAQGMPPISMRPNERTLTPEERERQKQIDDDYKATNKKVPIKRRRTRGPTFGQARPLRTQKRSRNKLNVSAMRRGGLRRISPNCPGLLTSRRCIIKLATSEGGLASCCVKQSTRR